MARAESIQTNWVVFTGGPSSGKTEVLLYLAQLGHHIVPEAARIHIIDQFSRGLTLPEIRRDEEAFQNKILIMKLEVEDLLNPKEKVFLDRGIPDTIAYAKLNSVESRVTRGMLNLRRYKQVFLFDQLPYVDDGVRIEGDDFAKALRVELRQVYTDLGYKVTDVPVIPIGDRAKFILRHLD